jgi:hypothetical protein
VHLTTCTAACAKAKGKRRAQAPGIGCMCRYGRLCAGGAADFPWGDGWKVEVQRWVGQGRSGHRFVFDDP